ncbi:MAG: phospho-N-acetylmuramoyl-pentapeptide-transferase [Planctomycetota bacterium]|jgi:phospho-N-acetylmuramoyl-pentapeptide-transferase
MLYLLLEATRDWLTDIGVYRFVMVLDQVRFRALFATLLSFLIVVVLGKRVIRWLVARKVGDIPRTDNAALDKALASKTNTPTMGGILIAGAILVSTLLLADVFGNIYVILSVILLLWMAILGGIDDYLKLTSANRPQGSRQGLYSWEKLVFQLGISLLVGWSTYTHANAEPYLGHVLNLPFWRTYDPATFQVEPSLFFLSMPVFIVITMLMIGGMSNAVNISDGMDGLAAGCSSLIALAMMILCLIAGSQVSSQELLVPYIPGSEELAVVIGAVAGATLGFLWWNCFPAAVFMGDTGSLTLGGLIGYIAVVIRQEAVVLLMCGIFLIEIGSVVIQVGYFKWTRGKRVFLCAPYHWHLHQSGWQEQKVVSRFWIVTIILIALGLASLNLR